MIYIKSIGKYTLVFIVTLTILFSSLAVTSCIPKSAIEENIKESVTLFKENSGIEPLITGQSCSLIHYYADSILLNIIYCIDSTTPIDSMLWSYFYQFIYFDLNNDFISLVEDDKEPNQEYLRYWHGSMSIIRPLLTILNIEQIYLLNGLLLFSLAIILFVIIFKRNRKLSIIYAISMLMIAFPIVPFCLEYSWTFYIMLITSIIALCIEKQGDNKLNLLFLISGMLTCFLDFLTTELITLFVPLVFVLIIRRQENRLTKFRQGLTLVIKASVLWSIGYVGMWLAKWVLASIILGINAMDYVFSRMKLRINGVSFLIPYSEMFKDSIGKNLSIVFPLNLIYKYLTLIIIPAVLGILISLFADWKNLNKKWFALLLILIAFTPYLRYLILANHSFFHSFFTFRAQIITIIALIWALTELLDFEKILNIKQKIITFRKEHM